MAKDKAKGKKDDSDDSSADGEMTLGEMMRIDAQKRQNARKNQNRNASMEREQHESHPSNWVWVPQIQRFVHPQHPLYLPLHSTGHQVRLAAEKEDKVMEEKVSTKQHLEIMLEKYMSDVLKQPNDKLKKEKYDALMAMFKRYPFWYGHDFIEQFNKSFDVHKKALAGTLPKTKFKDGDAELSSLAAQAVNVATMRKQEMERGSIHRSHLGDVPHEDPSVDIAADNVASKYAPDEQTRTRASERLIERAIKNEPTPQQLAALSDLATERKIRKGLASGTIKKEERTTAPKRIVTKSGRLNRTNEDLLDHIWGRRKPHGRILKIDPEELDLYNYKDDFAPVVDLGLLDDLIFTVPQPPPEVQIVVRVKDDEDDVVEVKKK